MRAGSPTSTDHSSQPATRVWFYDHPYSAVAEIKGHVAFYSNRVELTVETADGAED